MTEPDAVAATNSPQPALQPPLPSTPTASAISRADNATHITLATLAMAVVVALTLAAATVATCPEYFTAGPTLLGLQQATVLGLLWGLFLGCAWGLAGGGLLSATATLGSAPARSGRQLYLPLLAVAATTLTCAFLAGTGSYAANQWTAAELPAPLGELISPDKHGAYLAVATAHRVSLAVASFGILVVAIGTLRTRSAARPRPQTPPG